MTAYEAREGQARWHAAPLQGPGRPGAGASLRVEAALAALREGRLVVVVDDEDREDEGDLVGSAELMTAEQMAFVVRHTGGVVCVAMEGDRLDDLLLPAMVAANEDAKGTAFTVSVDLREGVTTGISAADRAATVRALADPVAKADDFARPGHVFPLRARPGGVLERRGHTEAAVDLLRLAGLVPAGVISEVVSDDGSMARRGELDRFAAAHGLPMVSVADLVEHRLRHEPSVRREAQTRLPTGHADFDAYGYTGVTDGVEHLALVLGDIAGAHDVVVRVHAECLAGDVLRSQACACGDRLQTSLRRIATAGQGILVYLRGRQGCSSGLLVGDVLRDLSVRTARVVTHDPGSCFGPAGPRPWTPADDDAA